MLIGIDWGGSKIEGVAMEACGRELLRLRQDTPRHDYRGCLAAVKAMIDRLEAETGQRRAVKAGAAEIPAGAAMTVKEALAILRGIPRRQEKRQRRKAYPLADSMIA